MISRSCAAALMAIICSVLTGCFYDHPLTETPSKDINTWLLGVWEHTNDKGDLDRATVLPLTGSRYTVWYESVPKTGAKKKWRFEGWISRVGKAVFLTLRCDEGPGDIPQGSYVFLHYQVLNQNRIAIRLPQLDAAPDASSYPPQSGNASPRFTGIPTARNLSSTSLSDTRKHRSKRFFGKVSEKLNA